MDEEDDSNELADEGDNVDEEVKALSSRKVEHSLETLKNYSLFSKNRVRQMMSIIFNFKNLEIVEKSENYKQSTTDEFFAPFFPFYCTPKVCIETCLQGFT